LSFRFGYLILRPPIRRTQDDGGGDYFIKSEMATVREIAKTTFTGSKSFKESKSNIENINIIIGKIIFNDKNIFNKKKKNKLNKMFINMIIDIFVGGTKITSKVIKESKSNSLATIISINYNNKL